MARNRNYKKKVSSTGSQSKESVTKDPSKEVNKDESTKEVNLKASDKVKDSLPSAANDPEWYNRDPSLTSAAARVPFSLPFGADLHRQHPGDVTLGGRTVASTYKDWNVPGICSLMLKHSMGTNVDQSSPANVCANALYTHVRYMNSGRKNYDPADLFIYVNSFADIYSYIYFCIRLYNYAYMYSQRNWYIGRDLIKACGVDPDDLKLHLAEFRYWINSMINKISSFCLPGDIYYFARRVFLYANYYLENPLGNIKDQLYQFVPEGFYKFELDANTNAGKLTYTIFHVPGTLKYLSAIQTYFESLLSNITGDEDFGLMSGDIRKAYGDNIMRIASISEEGGLLPVYDPYVLSQFKNAYAMVNLYRADSTKTYTDHLGATHVYGDIEQTADGLVVSMESFTNNAVATDYYLSGLKLLNVENPEPNEGDVIEATRLMPYGESVTIGSNTYYSVGCGSEIPVGVIMTTKPNPLIGLVSNMSYEGMNFTVTWTTRPAGTITNVNSVVYRSGFKYSPLVYIVHWDSSEKLVDDMVFGNLDNVTEVDNAILRRLHEVALLSLFYVPGVAKLV